MKITPRLKKKQAKTDVLMMTTSQNYAYAKRTTFISSFPLPSAITDFLCLYFTQVSAGNGGSGAPDKTPSGNNCRRLIAVVETRHPISVAALILNDKDSVMNAKQTVEQINKLNALQSQIQALLLILLHSTESEYLTNNPCLLAKYRKTA